MIILKKKKKESMIPVFLFCLMLIALGLKGLYWVATDTTNALKVKYWPKTDGIVLDSGVRSSYGDMFTGVEHSPRVKYRYVVLDKEYIGETISFPARRYASRSEAQQIAHQYIEGSVIKVYYDPEKPHVSALSRERVSFFFIAVIGTVSILMLALGAAVFRFTVGFIKKGGA